jgi:hypothetical protein
MFSTATSAIRATPNYTDVKFLRVIFCYCSNTWDAQLIKGAFQLDSFSSTGPESVRPSSVFFGVFIAEEFDGVGHRGSGNVITIEVHNLKSLFEHVPNICLFQ